MSLRKGGFGFGAGFLGVRVWAWVGFGFGFTFWAGGLRSGSAEENGREVQDRAQVRVGLGGFGFGFNFFSQLPVATSILG